MTVKLLMDILNKIPNCEAKIEILRKNDHYEDSIPIGAVTTIHHIAEDGDEKDYVYIEED